MEPPPILVLASGSPRRADLLRSIGARFTAEPPSVDESLVAGEAAAHYVGRLARSKATSRAAAGVVAIGADTTVVVDDEILGKPVDAADATKMLQRLSGRAHEVKTGVAVALGDRVVEVVVSTHVWFRDLTDAEIDWYVATGEPLDKAGAYGIQGIGGMFVECVHGSYQSVVGLPLAELDHLLTDLGHPLHSFTFTRA